MMLLGVFYVLIVAFIGLVAYAFIDTENRLYGNLIAEFIAIVLAFFLAANAITGNIVDHAVVQNGTATNVSSPYINTTYAHIDAIYPIQNPAVTALFSLVGLFLGIHFLRGAWEAVQETHESGGEWD